MNLSFTSRRMMIYAAIGAAALAFGIFSPSSDETSAAVTRGGGGSAKPRQSGSTLNSNAAAFLTRLAHRSADAATAEALFASRSWYVAPPPPPPAPPAPPRAAPVVPTAPPLPFTLLGSYAAQGDQATYFLSRDDRIYDVKPGDTIDADYTLVAVDGANLIFNYKPLNSRQSLALGGTQ
jgi:hypothetical protein